MSQVPMTPAGYEKLKDELEKLKGSRIELSRAIQDAREKGDLKENAEYHSAREAQSMNEGRIAEIEDRLARARVVTDGPDDKSAAYLGARVTVFDERFKEELAYYLVGEGEADPVNNRILTASPIGQALCGKKVGETVTARTPGGELPMKILKIEYGFDE